jgi:ComF family protein
VWGTDLLMFFFPVHCLVCGKKLYSTGEVLCLECEFNLPKTSFHDPINNPVCQAFWGRVPVEMGTSLLRFEKGSAYQSLLHDLKYRGNQRAGIYLGKMLGNEINHTTFSSCDILVPVPIHKKRLRERGYNQSEIIAKGISEVTGIPISNLLMRFTHHLSQTSMGRYDRFQNVSGNFRVCRNAPDMNGKKILLIDDVVTTGSTLEACSIEILSNFKCLIYIATVSYA